VKAALLSEYHRPLELIERPVPELNRPDELLVRIAGAGVCATDLHAIEGRLEPAGVSPPVVLGHENAGRVEQAGELVSTVAPGDAVILYPPYSCGLCVPCRRGDDVHCERHQFTGLTVDGGFADYVRVSERSVIKLPEGVDPVDVAPHADAGITAYHAVRKVAHLARPGAVSVVIGAGGVGHIALQLLRELGQGVVVVVETDERRRQLADELGADEVLDGDNPADAVRELTGGRGADLVLDFVGTDQTHAAGMAMIGRAATYVMVGFGGTLSVPSAAMVGNEQAAVASLVGSWIDLWEVVQLHAAGRLILKSETHPLEDVNEVLGMLREGEIIGRAVLVPEQ
jgi:NAD+-dependent secondary alcohol dehydrogenase Adh1